MSKVYFEDVFGEDEDLDEVISMIRHEDWEGVTNVRDELDYNEGWYNYSTVTFDYEGKRYSIEYKEHTSDNVSDMEYLHNTFVCLGDATEMDEKVSKEDLARIKLGYERRIENLERELQIKRDTLNILRPLPKKTLRSLGESFIQSTSELDEKDVSDETKKAAAKEFNTIGKFFIEVSNQK